LVEDLWLQEGSNLIFGLLENSINFPSFFGRERKGDNDPLFPPACPHSDFLFLSPQSHKVKMTVNRKFNPHSLGLKRRIWGWEETVEEQYA